MIAPKSDRAGYTPVTVSMPCGPMSAPDRLVGGSEYAQ